MIDILHLWDCLNCLFLHIRYHKKDARDILFTFFSVTHPKHNADERTQKKQVSGKQSCSYWWLSSINYFWTKFLQSDLGEMCTGPSPVCGLPRNRHWMLSALSDSSFWQHKQLAWSSFSRHPLSGSWLLWPPHRLDGPILLEQNSRSDS